MKLVRTILQIKLKKIGCKHCIITFTSVLASNYVLCVWFYIICSMVIHPTLRNKEPMNYIFWNKVFVKISFRMWKKLTQPLPLKNDWFGLALQGKIWTSKKIGFARTSTPNQHQAQAWMSYLTVVDQPSWNQPNQTKKLHKLVTVFSVENFLKDFRFFEKRKRRKT